MPPVISEWQFNRGTTEQPRWSPFGAEAQHKLEAAFEEVPKSKHLTVQSGGARYWINFDGGSRPGPGPDASEPNPTPGFNDPFNRAARLKGRCSGPVV